MKFADTPVAPDMKIYLKQAVRTVFKGLEPGDVLEWHINNGEVIVKKKVKTNANP